MRFVIWYFSGTGTTRLIATELARALVHEGQEAEAWNLEEAFDISRSAQRPEFWAQTGRDATSLRGAVFGFAFPVYKLTFPEIMEQYFLAMGRLNEPGGPARLAFLVATYCRFPGAALRQARIALGARGFWIGPRRAFKGPSNGICSLKSPGEDLYDQVMYFENGIAASVADFARELGQGGSWAAARGSWPRRPRLRDRLRIALVGRIEQARYPGITIDQDKCTRCGVCAKLCPQGNLALGARSLQIADPTGCLHCLRCLQLCPQRAVSFGPLVQGPGRYTPVLQRELYAQASRRQATDPEPAPWWAKYRWALGTALSCLGSRRG